MAILYEKYISRFYSRSQMAINFKTDSYADNSATPVTTVRVGDELERLRRAAARAHRRPRPHPVHEESNNSEYQFTTKNEN